MSLLCFINDREMFVISTPDVVVKVFFLFINFILLYWFFYRDTVSELKAVKELN